MICSMTVRVRCFVYDLQHCDCESVMFVYDLQHDCESVVLCL